MCQACRPATGWIAYLTSTPRASRRPPSSSLRVLGLRDGEARSRETPTTRCA
jgi:hypothetical protein